MPAHQLNLFLKKNNETKNPSKEEIALDGKATGLEWKQEQNNQNEIDPIEAQLEAYKEALKTSVTCKFGKGHKLLPQILDEGFFAKEHLDPRYHPRLWSKSDRVGASTIAFLPEENDVPEFWEETNGGKERRKNIVKSSYELLRDALKAELKKYPLISFEKRNKEEKIQYKNTRQQIKASLKELKQQQHHWNRAFLFDIIEQTQKRIVEQLAELMKTSQNKIDTNCFSEISQKMRQCETRSGGLALTFHVNELRNTVLRKFPNNLDLQQNIRQWSILSKRFLDQPVHRPQKLTITEKVVKGIRITTLGLGLGVAIAAGISFFVAPWLIKPLLMSSSALMGFSTIEDIHNFLQHFFNGRTPSKAELYPILAATPLLALYFAMGHIAVVGPFLGHATVWLLKKLFSYIPHIQRAYDFINNKVVPFLKGLSTFDFFKSLMAFQEKVPNLIISAPIAAQVAKGGHTVATVQSEKRKSSLSRNSSFESLAELMRKSIDTSQKQEKVPETEKKKDEVSHEAAPKMDDYQRSLLVSELREVKEYLNEDLSKRDRNEVYKKIEKFLNLLEQLQWGTNKTNNLIEDVDIKQTDMARQKALKFCEDHLNKNFCKSVSFDEKTKDEANKWLILYDGLQQFKGQKRISGIFLNEGRPSEKIEKLKLKTGYKDQVHSRPTSSPVGQPN